LAISRSSRPDVLSEERNEFHQLTGEQVFDLPPTRYCATTKSTFDNLIGKSSNGAEAAVRRPAGPVGHIEWGITKPGQNIAFRRAEIVTTMST
jgi:hypothetical protein